MSIFSPLKTLLFRSKKKTILTYRLHSADVCAADVEVSTDEVTSPSDVPPDDIGAELEVDEPVPPETDIQP